MDEDKKDEEEDQSEGEEPRHPSSSMSNVLRDALVLTRVLAMRLTYKSIYALMLVLLLTTIVPGQLRIINNYCIYFLCNE